MSFVVKTHLFCYEVAVLGCAFPARHSRIVAILDVRDAGAVQRPTGHCRARSSSNTNQTTREVWRSDVAHMVPLCRSKHRGSLCLHASSRAKSEDPLFDLEAAGECALGFRTAEHCYISYGAAAITLRREDRWRTPATSAN